MLAMDREVQTLRMELHRKEEDRQNEITLKENALAQVKELNAKVKEFEERAFALDLEAERERKEIEVLVEERDDAQKKLCRSESMLKESQVELQKLKQAVARHKKVDKAERALFSSNDTHPGAQHDQEVAAAARRELPNKECFGFPCAVSNQLRTGAFITNLHESFILNK
jgi:chromosome segregation ATPase